MLTRICHIKRSIDFHPARNLFLSSLICVVSFASCNSQTIKDTQLVLPAAYQMSDYLGDLKGKNIGLVVNPTSEINGTHLVDTLKSHGIKIMAIFAPEHGFRGTADAGEQVNDGIDAKTGIKIISLYGQHKKPTPEDLEGIEIVVFDIQDVGLRFYTYISTMHYVMEACAENKLELMVLDRPNPNGYYVDGPVLDMKFRSFVGMHPIPIVHGLTVGELATMINGEHWLDSGQCSLKVIKMSNYVHSDRYSLPVKPSPNLPNDRSIQLYASLCLLEPTLISIGRGTTFPFQVLGYPQEGFGPFGFTPESIVGMSKYPKYENINCFGYDLQTEEVEEGFHLSYVLDAYNKLNKADSFFTSPSFFDKLAGTDNVRKQIIAQLDESEIRSSWEPELNNYKLLRKKYLLYQDFE